MEWRVVAKPSTEIMKELLKLIKYPLMTVDFLASQVLLAIGNLTSDESYKEMVVDCINYQHLLTNYISMEQPGARNSSVRDKYREQILHMQSVMCKNEILDNQAFQARKTSLHVVFY
jgi:hypothetical protein